MKNIVWQWLPYGIWGLFCCVITSASAQSPKRLQQQLEPLWQQERYAEALRCLDKLGARRKLSADLLYKRAVCLYKMHKLNESLGIFQRLATKKQVDIYFYTACIYHEQGEFSEANLYYRLFLQKADAKNVLRTVAKARLRQLAHAPRLMLEEQKALLSVVPELNTDFDEFNLQKFPRFDSLFFFSSNRPKQGDSDNRLDFNTWQIILEQGVWHTPLALPARYNSEADEYLQHFLDDGFQIAYIKDNQLLIDNYDDDTLQLALPFSTDLANCKGCWNGDAFWFSNDMVLFASSRQGGAGGLDLYWTMRTRDSAWLAPQSFGISINTKFDERTPFLANDGRTLYFSTNRPESLGGFDIYKTVFDDSTQTWSAAEHVAYPISSFADDLFFYPQNDGVTAFVSSNRAGGKGGFELLVANFRRFLPEQETHSQPATFAEVLQRPQPTVYKPSEDTVRIQSVTADPLHRSYRLTPVYYTDVVGDHPTAANNLEMLKSLLLSDNELLLVVNAHTDNTGEPLYDMYLSLKQAETFIKPLLEADVSPNRILLRGLGQQYPVARNDNYDLTPCVDGQKLNRRLDLAVVRPSQQPTYVSYQRAQVSPILQMPQGAQFDQTQQGLLYKIELRRTNTLWRHDLLRAGSPVCVEQLASEPAIAYMYGEARTFAAIEKLYQEQVLNKGFSAATIVPYLDGVRLDSVQAAAYVGRYSDLLNYLSWKK